MRASDDRAYLEPSRGRFRMVLWMGTIGGSKLMLGAEFDLDIRSAATFAAASLLAIAVAAVVFLKLRPSRDPR
jgi:hypothetical protein